MAQIQRRTDEYQDFDEAVRSAGLKAMWCSHAHWKIVSHKFTVNVWPQKKQRGKFKFLADGEKGRAHLGTLKQAINHTYEPKRSTESDDPPLDDASDVLQWVINKPLVRLTSSLERGVPDVETAQVILEAMIRADVLRGL